jgi:TP901 family phage tail tape measure protein
MSNLGTITYTTNIETSQLVSSGKVADKQLDSLQKSFDDTDKASQQLGGGLNKLATSIAGVLSVAAVVNEFKKAIAVTMEFNATISNLSALTGAVGKDLEVFRQAAIDIGGSTSLSASQAAEAMKLIGSASPELLKSADALKAVTQQAVTLAEAAGSTLPEAAAALTGALNQFQLGADQAGRVINVLAAGAKEGSSEINDTVAAMQNAGVVAAQAGLNFEQFNGAVQALAQGQIKGAEAGTGLRNVLTILNTQVKSELRPSVVGLSTALANLEKAGLDDTQMVKLFGRENITVAKVMLQFRGTMDQVTTAITGTSEAYRQAAVNQDNLKGDVANLSSAFETLQIAIGDLSDSTLRDLTRQLTDMLSSFGSNQESLSSFFEVTGSAALSFAAIITGRVVTGLAGYATAQATAIKVTFEQIGAAQAAAGANLMLAKSEDAAAQAALAKVKALQASALGLKASTEQANQLAAAEARATAATNGLNSAITASAGVATKSAAAISLLSKATAFLGGPLGVFLLAATAVSIFTKESAAARVEVDALNGSLEKLSFNQLSRSAQEIQGQISDLNGQLAVARNNFNSLSNDKSFMSAEKFAEKNTKVKAALDDVNQALAIRTARLAEIASAQDKIANPAQAPAKDPVKAASPIATTTEDGQKALDLLKDQLALAKLTGEAKARLQAIQKLGSAATEQEKAEAASLGEEIYKLESATKLLGETNKKQKTEAEKLAKKSAEEEKKGIEENLKAIDALQEAIYQAGLSTAELAERKAELSLNEYATAEDIESVKALGTELEKLNALQAKRKEFGTPEEAKKKVTGTVDPLSGGEFDNQAARYQAEAEAEVQRYADQMTRLNEAKAAQIEVMGGYQTLEEQMAQQHADRMNQIDTARNSVILNAAEQGFGGVADIMKNAFGEQSALYRVAFVAQKAAAIASATIAIQQGIALAAANPWPINLAAMASVAAASASLVGNIASVAAPGRALGGPVQANEMYRVNETGAPEVFNAANGRQYMMPNSRGEVVSNKDATAGGASAAGNAPVINNHNYSGQTMESTAKFSEQDRRWVIDTIVGDMMGDGRTSRATNQITGTRRQGV